MSTWRRHDRVRNAVAVAVAVVVGGVREPGALVAGVVGLEDQELTERVGLAEVVLALVVGVRRIVALVLNRVATGADAEAEVGHTRLVGVVEAVTVEVVEHRAGELGEPTRRAGGRR